jgi:serine/threonine-protein kinase
MQEIDRLGKYEIRRVLGRGAMGVVYLGFDPFIERPVAIKTIRKDTLDPELAAQFLLRFKNEARAAGRLTHANIVGVYEYGEQGSVAYIVMEYVEGTGLREYLNRQTAFDFAQLVELMTQLLSALEFAHRCGVVHRDIKPSNLIVTDAGLLKVADFGVARVDMSNLTVAGMVIGTPSYMSPEQCSGNAVDVRSDLFSAGVVLYELLSGQRPFIGSVEAIAYKICHEEPAPPSQISGLRLPKEVDGLVARALAKRPADRFPSARAFREALHEVAQIAVQVDQGGATTVVNIGTIMLQKPAPYWDDETLVTAEHELARFLGPMARVLVRRAAAQTQDRGELCALLCESIDDPDTRRQFIDAFTRSASGARARPARASGVQSGPRGSLPGQGSAAAGQSVPGSAGAIASGPGSAGAGRPVAAAAGVPLDSAYVEQVSAQLAVYLGPIAQIVTKRAAQRAASRGEFVRMVADHLGTQDRVAFLRELGYAEG